MQAKVVQARPEQMTEDVVDDRGQTLNALELRKAVEQEGKAFSAQVNAAVRRPQSVRTTARYQLRNGTIVILEQRAGAYRVQFAPMAQDCPATVVDALLALRTAISNSQSIRHRLPLTVQARTDVELESKALLEGLRYADELAINEVAYGAEVTLASGHTVRLKQQYRCWLIDEVR